LIASQVINRIMSFIPVHDEIQRGDIAFVRSYLDAGGDVNSDESGETMLTWAASMGQTEIVKLLIARGANPAIQSKGSGWTPLMNATMSRHTEVVHLLSKDALDKVNKDGETALIMAAYQGFPELFPHLVTPTNVQLVDKRGHSALSYAMQTANDHAYKGHKEYIEGVAFLNGYVQATRQLTQK